MNSTAQLGTAVPDELTEEFLKRVPYVSEGISNVRFIPGSTTVAFELRPGFESQAELVAPKWPPSCA
jgi:hypothetical protein